MSAIAFATEEAIVITQVSSESSASNGHSVTTAEVPSAPGTWLGKKLSFILQNIPLDDLGSFHQEFRSAFALAIRSRDWANLRELLEAWEATAEIYSDPRLTEALDQALTDLQERWGDWQETY